MPNLIIGNFLLPNKCIEPSGKVKIFNENKGIYCEINFLKRACTSKYNKYKQN